MCICIHIIPVSIIYTVWQFDEMKVLRVQRNSQLRKDDKLLGYEMQVCYRDRLPDRKDLITQPSVVLVKSINSRMLFKTNKGLARDFPNPHPPKKICSRRCYFVTGKTNSVLIYFCWKVSCSTLYCRSEPFGIVWKKFDIDPEYTVRDRSLLIDTLSPFRHDAKAVDAMENFVHTRSTLQAYFESHQSYLDKTNIFIRQNQTSSCCSDWVFILGSHFFFSMACHVPRYESIWAYLDIIGLHIHERVSIVQNPAEGKPCMWNEWDTNYTKLNVWSNG